MGIFDRELTTADDPALCFIHAIEVAICSLSKSPEATDRLLGLLVTAVGELSEQADED